ncbi:MAG: SAM-dependent methyltransferase [Gallionella sp.]
MKTKTELQPGQSDELLKALHILTRDGRLNQDSRRKLKQVNHLFQFMEPLLEETLAHNLEFNMVDHGAGKSYLGFLAYELFLKKHQTGHIYSIETRSDLVTSSKQLANKLAYTRMSFLNLSVEASKQSPKLPESVDIVTALHACDTATDDAIRFALIKRSSHILLVPCCQAEVAAALNRNKNQSFGKTPLSEIWRHPIHTREFGSHITNVLRCLLLESHGYQVKVTELVGWEHSMKNELIIASRKDASRNNAQQRLEQIIQLLNLDELRHRFIY